MLKYKTVSFNVLLIVSAVIGVGISYGKLYLFHVALVLNVSIFLFYSLGKINLNEYRTKHHHFLFFMLFWYLLSSLWSLEIARTMRYVGYIIFGTSIVLAILQYNTSIERINKLFKVAGIIFCIEILISLFEGVGIFRWPISPYSRYVVFFGKEMGVTLSISQEALRRILTMPTGFQWNPNSLSATMSLILPFFLFHNNKKIKYLGTISIFLIVLMTISRGNLIAVFFIVILYALAYGKKRAYRSILLLLILIPILLFVFQAMRESDNVKLKEISYTFEALSKYLFSRDLRGGSIGIRQRLIANGIAALSETNGLGVGGGCSNVVQERAGNTYGITSMHNIWIEILVEAGIAFFAAFAIWYFLMIFKLYRIALRTRDKLLKYYASACSLSLTGFIIAAISASTAIYILPMWILFGFSISIMNFHKKTLKNMQENK